MLNVIIKLLEILEIELEQLDIAFIILVEGK